MVVAVALLAACAGGSGTASSSTTESRLMACGAKKTFAYASHPGVDPNLTSLDVYTPPADEHGCSGKPLVVWIHGGGWSEGDKTEYMTDKIPLFNGAGYVFASINYRLTDKTLPTPAPQYPVHDQDSADAVAWLIQRAGELGIDASRVALLGHSAGGGIVAGLATDDQYLGHSKLPLTTVTCVGSMDGEGYDIVAGASDSPPEVQTGYRKVFTSDPATWEKASPIRHVAAGKGIPRFFVAAPGGDWRLAQHIAFIEALRKAGVPTTVLDVTALEHADLATDVGAPGDTLVTPALMDFLGGCFTPKPH